MSPNQRFLAALAVGVVLYVLPSTLEMERRSHGLRGASRASHIEDGMHFPTHDDAAGAGSVPLSASPLPAASGLQAAPIPGPNKLAAGSATVVLRKNHMELVHAGAKQQHQQEAPRPPPQRDEQQQQQHEGEQEQARPQAQGSGPPAGDATPQDGTESSSDTAPIEQREVEFDDGDDAAGETSREVASQESGVVPEGGSAAAGAPAEPGVAAGGSGKQPTGVEGDAHRPHRAAHQPRGAGQGADHGAGHRSHSHSGGGGHTGRGVTPADMGPDGLGALPGSPTCGECSHHGICQYGPAGTFQSCECAVLYAGAPDCSKVTEFAKPAPMASFQGRYDKALILSKSSVRGRAELKTIRDPTAKTKALRQMITVAKVGSRLTRALPEHDPTDRRVYRTCAIVGSSGILLKYHRGEEIDKHDMVFRFNSAPTRGFEKFCGRKTTHRITNSRNFAYREFPTEIDMQHMRSPNNIESLITQRRKHPKTRFFGIHPDFINYMDDSLDFLATSGLFGIMIAMHKCAQIDIYGFQVHSRHGVQYHYYNPKDLPANEGRDDTEFQVIKALAEAGFFRFAEPCILECHESADACSQCKAASGGWQ